MTYPRSHTVPPGAHGVYHCVSRCVRRAWLCGHDTLTGRSFEHRKDWIQARLFELSDIFAIDLWGFAVMSNHYHVVLETQPARAAEWSDREVAERWLRLSRPTEELSHARKLAEISGNPERVRVLRGRLADLSWFMRCINEPLARSANREDECTGRFWQGRFHSEALLDDRAVLAAIAYVDLNPVRAGVVDRPEEAEHTGLAYRLETASTDEHGLLPLERLGLSLPSYLVLLRWTAHGEAPADLPVELNWLDRTGIYNWSRRIAAMRAHHLVQGTVAAMQEFALACGQQWFRGVGGAPSH